MDVFKLFYIRMYIQYVCHGHDHDHNERFKKNFFHPIFTKSEVGVGTRCANVVLRPHPAHRFSFYVSL